ncbi:MAG: hypothetical protein HC817_12975 [Saprospiraceae bacterium]|nr:hypothetical protein [Saprospiraceae bacterium]
MKADIQSFQIKNYDYRNATLTGNFARKLFNGRLESKDPNADFVFDGAVDFAAATPVFKFKSDILRVDLKTLNLTNIDLAIGGNLNLDLTGQNFRI